MNYPVYTTLAESEVIEVIHAHVAIGDISPDSTASAAHLYHTRNGMLLAYFDPNSTTINANIESGVGRFCRETIKLEDLRAAIEQRKSKPKTSQKKKPIYPALSSFTLLAEPEVTSVIHTRVGVGEVRPGDAPRTVHLYFALDGALLAQFDPYSGQLNDSLQSDTLRVSRMNTKADLDSMDFAYVAPTEELCGSAPVAGE
ncbi:hypothetical protein PQR71_10210 [Paraburkholderia fungorum]|uniref:hypothetical protein n=1 Tax=Paraburkholderia fungorum TaxID=134537 RepID=UPI0038BD2C9A